MSVIRCQVCGGKLILQNNHLAVCENCDSLQSLPRIDGTVQSTYERANHNRCNKEFDRAIDQFNKVLDAYPQDAATYWQIVLCKFGVYYEKDPRTGDYKPTVHRMMRTSLMADPDYLKALEYATPQEKEIYEEKAAEIYQIQQRYERISQREKAFDVFISYKDTEDATGERTRDSEIAHRIYNDLTAKGLRVFFSHITLREKSGEDYEPYIFAALESAPVMLLVTTSAQHVNGVWVRNEWMRYLALTAKSSDKVLIPVIQDMDPYDLPTEIGHLQAVNLQAVGALPQLIARVQELTRRGRPAAAAPAAAMPVANDVRPLVDGLFRRIAEGNDVQAQNYLDRIAALDPHNAQAHLGRLMLRHNVRSVDALAGLDTPLNAEDSFQQAMKYADEATSKQLMTLLDRQKTSIYARCMQRVRELQPQWEHPVEALDVPAHEQLARDLYSLEGYHDSAETRHKVLALIGKAQHGRVRQLEKDKKFEEALALLETLPPDSETDTAIERLRNKIQQRNLLSDRKNRRTHVLGIATCVVQVVFAALLALGCYMNYAAGDPKAALMGMVPLQLPLEAVGVLMVLSGLLHGLTVENENFFVEKINGLGQIGLPVLMGVRTLLSMWVPAQGFISEALFVGLLAGAVAGGICFVVYNVVGMITALCRKESFEWNRLFW